MSYFNPFTWFRKTTPELKSAHDQLIDTRHKNEDLVKHIELVETSKELDHELELKIKELKALEENAPKRKQLEELNKKIQKLKESAPKCSYVYRKDYLTKNKKKGDVCGEDATFGTHCQPHHKSTLKRKNALEWKPTDNAEKSSDIVFIQEAPEADTPAKKQRTEYINPSALTVPDLNDVSERMAALNTARQKEAKKKRKRTDESDSDNDDDDPDYTIDK